MWCICTLYNYMYAGMYTHIYIYSIISTCVLYVSNHPLEKESSNKYSSYSSTPSGLLCHNPYMFHEKIHRHRTKPCQPGSAETRKIVGSNSVRFFRQLEKNWPFKRTMAGKQNGLEDALVERKPILKRPAPPWCYAVSKRLSSSLNIRKIIYHPPLLASPGVISYTLLGTKISHPKAVGKMSFLSHWWDMLVHVGSAEDMDPVTTTVLGARGAPPPVQHRCQIQHQEKHQPGFAKTYLQNMAGKFKFNHRSEWYFSKLRNTKTKASYLYRYLSSTVRVWFSKLETPTLPCLWKVQVSKYLKTQKQHLIWF